MTKEKEVYVVNKAGHDFSKAEEYGELVFLSEGPINRYSLTAMYREFSEKLKDSSPGDFILPTGYSIMTMIAGAIFAHKHERINVLLYKDGNYISRSIVLNHQDEDK
ncbi:hypothetical protein LCGC14_2891130 [marine sediment metagenome]|uniref:Uncharacterized protein n=1 Tax=marine sediment metagenome TaxID=412755 RepID=A0A0F8XX70_9ZZZZ